MLSPHGTTQHVTVICGTSNLRFILLVQDYEDAIKQSEQGIWDAFSVEDLLHKGIASQLEALQTISVNASKEYGLEKALDKMHADWEGLEFRIMEYKDTGTYIVGGTDDIQVPAPTPLFCDDIVASLHHHIVIAACIQTYPVIVMMKICMLSASILSGLLHCRQFWMTRL